MNEIAPDSVPARLAFVVGRFNRRLASATGGLSHGLLSALATVAKRGPVRLADLAQTEMVSAPSITRVVAELESRGLITRSIDEDDRRAFRIEVTQAGMDAVLRARAARSRVVADLLADLSPAEVATIAAALPALERVLEQI
ncbi:MAG: transcriptional regulator, MarR family [Glaciihabitans sp.]|jgi:DNA-binding MarR family transcriptional regulator|nr:transcriptional regulator, MarR family [Glaciihabitans sp.]